MTQRKVAFLGRYVLEERTISLSLDKLHQFSENGPSSCALWVLLLAGECEISRNSFANFIISPKATATSRP